MGIQEQEEELEALSFIYPQEFTKTSSNSLEIIITEQYSRQDLKILLKAEFPLEYPDVALLFSLTSQASIDSTDKNDQVSLEDLEILTQRVTDKIQEFIGLAMVFSIVEFIKTEIIEILNQKFTIGISAESQNTSFLKENIQKVDKETFLKWKSDLKSEIIKMVAEKKEMSQSLKDFAEIEKIFVTDLKITGRQMFERDQTLINTDLFSQEAEDDVVVDLKLFNRIKEELEDEKIDLFLD